MEHEKIVRVVNRISFVVFISAIVAGIYIMHNGIGLIEGLDFGPGQYYYTDLPNWHNYFLEDKITFNSEYPVLFMVLFIGWAIVAWKLWNWLDEKIK